MTAGRSFQRSLSGTASFTLEKAGPEDAEAYAKNFARLDKELVLFTGCRKEYTHNEVIDFFNFSLQDPDRVFFLLKTAAGEIIGEAIINEIDWSNRCANFRTAVFRPEYRNAGLGSWMSACMKEYAFDVLKLHRIELDVFSSNPRAIKAYEKAGFEIEGIRRQAILQDGIWIDDILMACLSG